MASNVNTTASSNVGQATCEVRNGSEFFIAFSATTLFVLFACKAVHWVLGRFSQPRLVSELIVGLILGNVPFLKSLIESSLLDIFKVTESFCSSLYFFVLGLEMEPASILKPPGPEAQIAVASILCTLFMNISLKTIYSVITHGFDLYGNDVIEYVRRLLLFDFVMSSSSSPIVTRLVTQLKLGQSEIGRTAVRAGLATELTSTLALCFLDTLDRHGHDFFLILSCVAAEILFVIFVIRGYLFRWVNERNPEGRPLRGIDLSLVVVSTQMLCQMGGYFRYDYKFNSFLIGLALPRQGRVSNILISKINYVLTSLILPLYMTMVGLWANFSNADGKPWFVVSVVTFLSIIIKILGVSVICLKHGLHWLEAITVGMILGVKGYIQIIFMVEVTSERILPNIVFSFTVIIIIISIFYVPPTVLVITKKLRKIKGASDNEHGAVSLQWYNPESELKILIGIHNERDIAASMAVVEMMRAGSEAGAAVVYCTDLIELTEEKKSALVYRQDTDEVTVADEYVVKLRDEIGKCLDSFVGEKMTIHRSLAISSFSDMHDDICCIAEDGTSVFILLPFHKSPMDDVGHSGYRIVNQNVLANAPCSVGILIDRGLGHKFNYGNLGTFSSEDIIIVNVAMIFIGGADDREALTCASMMARHPLVCLKVIRIVMADDENDKKTERQELHERELDNETLSLFYERNVQSKSSRSGSTMVGYVERRLKNGVEMLNMLREMEEEQDLCIVGQGRKPNSVLTNGLSEWAECPELGPVGDILAGSDSPLNVSVLVVQQRSLAVTHERYIDDDFVPF